MDVRRGLVSVARVALVATLAASVAACGAEQVVVPAARHGDPIDAGVKPTADECGQLIRREQAAAQRIRAEYRIDGLPSTAAAVAAAAADPQADLATLGIPVTPKELEAVKRSGYALDDRNGITAWVSIGAPDRFGGVWIDPPGGDTIVVAIVGSDPSTLALARCMEPAKARYVHAPHSLESGLALQKRITDDWQAIRAMGIEMNSIGYLENLGIVEVTVTNATGDVIAYFTQRYGPDVRVVQGGPVVPA